MMLTVGVILAIGGLGLVGVLRGLRRGLLALGGTLLAIVVLDLWQPRWATWLQTTFSPEQPALPLFLMSALVFLLIALLLGYGGSAALGMTPTHAQGQGLRNRLLGGLLGGLNGALLVSYLLRYAADLWPAEQLDPVLRASPPAELLWIWAPRLVLGVVLGSCVYVLVRLAMGMIGRGMADADAAPLPGPQRTAAAPGGTDSDQRFLDAVSRVTGKK